MTLCIEITFIDHVYSKPDKKKINIGEKTEMTSIISKCSICDQFFDSKKKLRDHKDKDHRITDLKMISIVLTENQTKQAAASVKRRYQEEENI
jgi:transglutaminase/protease-like cytokinesis protein 3